MLRRTITLTAAAAVAADVCNFRTNGELCPGIGAGCNQDMLCLSGSCIAERWGDSSWSGTCRDDGPDLVKDIYGKTCDPEKPTDCIYYNPLSLTPRSGPSYLQCARAPGDHLGSCRLQPNNHGDACNVDGECASRKCLREIRLCKGIDEGEKCTPGLYPDQCSKDHYCAPDPVSTTGGKCQKSVSAGRPCNFANACERGFYCAASSLTEQRRCVAPFTFRNAQNTTIGPYMCESANALLLQKGETETDSVYGCIAANVTLTGASCNAGENATVPPGYTCSCASDGQNRLRTVNGLGLGARSGVWRELYNCLLESTNVMGDPCEFDNTDMERVRYGSCTYYACYPYYLRLVNVTGGRTFTDPLSQFEPNAQCETRAAAKYYSNVFSTPCLAIPNMENWKCAKLDGPHSLSVASTSAVVGFIIVSVIFGYWGHMWFQKRTATKLGGELGSV